jgi:glyoxylase-like metal-dependent hydrolase (beta-lactamase superfamily II)
MLKFKVIPVTPFQQNCSLIWCDQTLQGAIIDPGGELDKIEHAIKSNNIQVEQILLTHAHIDHAGAASECAKRYNIPIIGPHREDDFWIQLLPQVAMQYGFPPSESFTPNRWLEDNDKVQIGHEELYVYHCPGHTPGHVIFYHQDSQQAWVGDILFRGSIGRTDFPRGDYDTLIRSIKGKLWPLGNDVRFVSGHGPMSTFGAERQTNPFVKDK